MESDDCLRTEISVVIPAFNEEKRICRTLSGLTGELARWSDSFEIVVVDDGSRDRTSEVSRGCCRPPLRLISLPDNRGKGEAVRQGVLAAKGRFLFLVDADLPYCLDFIPRALETLRAGSTDAVIGARDLPASERDPTYPKRRVIAGKIFSRIVNLLLPLGIPDTQCGFKAFRGDLLRSAIAFTTQRNYVIDIEILLLLRLWQVRIERIPVRLKHHHGSKVHLILDSLKMLVGLMRIAFNYRRGWYPEAPPDGRLEPVACPVCSNSASRPVPAVAPARFCRCYDCGTLYRNPRPSESQLNALYDADYFASGRLDSGYQDYDAFTREQRPTMLWLWEQIETAVRRPLTRVLDIGCGSGEFLRAGLSPAAGERARECWGIDLSPPKDPSGFRYIQSGFPSPDLPEDYFDLVVFNDSFEHFVRPREILAAANRLLRMRGVVAINTPDSDSLIARWSGRGWISFKVEHFVLHRKAALIRMLAESGFRTLAAVPSRQRTNWNYVEPRLRNASAAAAWLAGAVRGTLPKCFWVPTGGILLVAEKLPEP